MSKVPLYNFNTHRGSYSSLPGVVLEINKDEKLLILWNSYTEWVDQTYLLRLDKVNE